MSFRFLLTITFLLAGLVGFAQGPDSSLIPLAKRKALLFSNYVSLLANKGIGLASKRNVQIRLAEHFIENKESKFLNDLAVLAPQPEKITSEAYLRNMMVHFPEGALVTFSAPEISPVFFNEARSQYYVKFRYVRSFKGFNVITRKEVSVNNSVDFYFKLSDHGRMSFRFIGSGPASQPLSVADEMSVVSAFPALAGEENAVLKAEEIRFIEECDNDYALLKTKADFSVPLTDQAFGNKNLELQKADIENQRLQAKLEKRKLENDIKSERRRARDLAPPKFNLKFGFGFFMTDSTVNAITSEKSLFKKASRNFMLKSDLTYRFMGHTRSPNNKWERGQMVGLFLSGGRQSGHTAYRIMHAEKFAKGKVDSVKDGNSYFEAEVGFVLKEQFRISGGLGTMVYRTVNEQGKDRTRQVQNYYNVTVGLAPRFFDLIEMDFNVTGLIIEDKLFPRLNVNLCFLIQTGYR